MERLCRSGRTLTGCRQAHENHDACAWRIFNRHCSPNEHAARSGRHASGPVCCAHMTAERHHRASLTDSGSRRATPRRRAEEKKKARQARWGQPASVRATRRNSVRHVRVIPRYSIRMGAMRQDAPAIPRIQATPRRISGAHRVSRDDDGLPIRTAGGRSTSVRVRVRVRARARAPQSGSGRQTVNGRGRDWARCGAHRNLRISSGSSMGIFCPAGVLYCNIPT
ncbi:hypothetical protein C8Q77DRAFT_38165 [Trametes polyzona]|nr:hypothetical protein C8Q77DRAFT_38165 [Trametes polyzona]